MVTFDEFVLSFERRRLLGINGVGEFVALVEHIEGEGSDRLRCPR